MISWFQTHMLPCALKTFFGIDCPICGFQRSLLELLKGNLYSSFKIYPPLVFVLALIAMFLVYLVFPNIVKQKYLRFYAAFVLVIIAVNYMAKIVSGGIISA